MPNADIDIRRDLGITQIVCHTFGDFCAYLKKYRQDESWKAVDHVCKGVYTFGKWVSEDNRSNIYWLTNIKHPNWLNMGYREETR